jgi:hypothetical protein
MGVFYSKNNEDNYWIYNDCFIFKPSFNKSLINYIKIIKKYKRLIFSNFDDLKTCIETKSDNERFIEYNNTYSQFNQPITNLLTKLPELEELKFGNEFNQLLTNDSFNNTNELKILIFGFKFNQLLTNGCLDNLTQLEELNFGICFNQPLENSLYKLTQLKKLVFSEKFNQLPIKFFKFYGAP